MSIPNRLKRLEERTEEPATISPDEENRLWELIDMLDGDPNYNEKECMELCYKFNPMKFQEQLRNMFKGRMPNNEFIE